MKLRRVTSVALQRRKGPLRFTFIHRNWHFTEQISRPVNQKKAGYSDVCRIMQTPTLSASVSSALCHIMGIIQIYLMLRNTVDDRGGFRDVAECHTRDFSTSVSRHQIWPVKFTKTSFISVSVMKPNNTVQSVYRLDWLSGLACTQSAESLFFSCV